MSPYHFHMQRGWFSIIQHVCSHSIGYIFQGSGERSVNSSHLSPSHRNEPAAATVVKQGVLCPPSLTLRCWSSQIFIVFLLKNTLSEMCMQRNPFKALPAPVGCGCPSCCRVGQALLPQCLLLAQALPCHGSMAAPQGCALFTPAHLAQGLCPLLPQQNCLNRPDVTEICLINF